MQENTLREIINEFSRNVKIFKSLLSDLNEETYLWKQEPGKWCILEIVCHLYDEEREDFRARIEHVFKNSNEPLPLIDPPGWVKSRNYMEQDFSEKLSKFFMERENSIMWMKSLKNPKWDNAYDHPKFGKMTAKMFLSNWLAHDYLHIRQIIKLKFDYLKNLSNESLTYAGEW